MSSHFEWTGSTTTMKKYYNAGGQRVAMRQGSSTVYWLLGDHLGSTAITATSAGAKSAELRYKAWGETRYTSGTPPTSLRYTGQRLEESLGIYQMGARWYDPALGRFLSPDTIIPDFTNPQSLNRFSYGYNNALKYRDPTGHRPAGACEEGESCEPPPEQPDPPFWDVERGAVRHLVESCTWEECSAAMFDPYTPGGWNFAAADMYHAATVHIYAEGPVSLDDALEAAEAGQPNPLSNEQLFEGLEEGSERYPLVPLHIAGVRNQSWFGKLLIEEFGWGEKEAGRLANYEPRYLYALVVSHPAEVERTYNRVMADREANPDAWEAKQDIGKFSRR